MSTNLSLRTIAERCRTEADAYELLEELRWHGEPVCPHCGSVSENHYFLTAKNGGRKTRTGKVSERRVWKCRDCRRQFTVLVGTIFHGTKIPIRTWLTVLVQVSSAKNGISAREVERMHGLTAETAWHMLHRIREAMRREPLAALFTGEVVADETWYGGAPKNRHGHKRGTGGQGKTDKTPVVALVHKESGEVRAAVVPTVSGANLRRVLAEYVDLPNATLHTDESAAYNLVSPEFAAHETVNHKEGEYVRAGVSTNQAEAFFSQFKRSLDGTHHHVSREHLHRYVDEFAYRWSTRKMSDGERLERIVSQAGGRRLTYLPVA